ncbi:pyridoxal phosphate-dependent decarboxylase family protein [Kribbella ginsengisoli]|uniref:Pyridoxal-dependent decarboxylase n=1 Tax=Kribbella ginsengisoli TaxID=363865 RepID=A0ABP6ZA11_9ACTN
MHVPDWNGPLQLASRLASEYLAGLPARLLGPEATAESLRKALGGQLPDHGEDASTVVRELATAADSGLLPGGSGRFFGFVFGGATPAAIAADWLATAWDQNAGLHAASPAAAVVEEVAGDWLKRLLGLPDQASVGFVTGAQMASFTGLAAARNHVLARAGWDVERSGLVGAPPITIIAGDQRHDTIDRALRFLGLGTDSITSVASDDQGRMRADALADALRDVSGPVVVCAQVGNVNSGAIDPVDQICDLAHEAGAWVHIDGAFGLWALSSPRLRPLLEGVQRADSWATDAHKWLSVPFDSGLVFSAHPEAHTGAMSIRAPYLIHDQEGHRDPLDYNPEFSRRARGFAVYAALRALGRSGVADVVERCCGLARLFADKLAESSQVEILNDVVLNQVLVRFLDPNGDHDAFTRQLVSRVQRDGTCWMSGTTWRGMSAMRISVCNWTTDDEDIDRSVAAIMRCLQS